jgi:hypothetical protein
MNTVQSADGTTIAFSQAGQGPPLILVDGALCSRSFGPMPKLATQLTPHFTVFLANDWKGKIMRKIAAGLFVSLDGVVESPEKWTGPYFNDQVGQAVGALMAANDAMLLGRTTYQGFAAAFGGQSGGIADQMNNTPKFVVSGTLTSADWQNSTLIRGDVAEQISRLKQQPARTSA